MLIHFRSIVGLKIEIHESRGKILQVATAIHKGVAKQSKTKLGKSREMK